jgi:hypothetical protein
MQLQLTWSADINKVGKKNRLHMPSLLLERGSSLLQMVYCFTYSSSALFAVSGGPLPTVTSESYKYHNPCHYSVINTPWYISEMNIHRNLEVPFQANHMTESFDLMLSDVGTLIAWQLGRYIVQRVV